MQTTLLFIITTSNRVFPTGGWGVSPTSREFAQSPLHLERFHVVDSPPQPNFYSATPKVKSPTN